MEHVSSAWNRKALAVAADYIVANYPETFPPEEKVHAHILAKRHLQNLREMNQRSDDISSDLTLYGRKNRVSVGPTPKAKLTMISARPITAVWRFAARTRNWPIMPKL